MRSRIWNRPPRTPRAVAPLAGLWASVLLLALLVALPWTPGRAGAAQQPLRAGQPAPDFATHTLDGAPVRLSGLQGQWVMLNFWAVWCPPCVKELPSMQRLAQQLADLPFRIVALNVMDSEARIRSFLTRQPLTLDIWRDPDGAIQRSYVIHAFPTTLLVSPTGVVMAVKEGGATWDAPRTVDMLRRMITAHP